VNAGINGVSNSSYLGNGIALWFGGDMIDKDNYTAGNRPANVATSLIRFDGSGYLGYVPNSDSSKDEAAIWWDASGNIHANPLSFFVGPESVGLLMSAFQVVPSTSNRAAYVIQRAPFQTVRIGNAYLGYDVVNNAVYVYTLDSEGNEVACNFYARGGVSALGFTEGSGGSGGLDVNAMWDILGESGIEQIHPSHISTALIDYVNNIIVNGTGNVVTSITKQGNDINVNLGTVQGASSWADITGKPTTLAGYGITDAVTIGTAQTITGFKTFGVRQTTNTGEANRIEITPYKHTGTWYVNVYDTPSIAYLRLRYGESDIPFSLSHQGDLTISGKYIKSGGTASQFLKADGSVDSNVYLTAANLDHIISVDSRSNPTLPNTFGNGLRAEFKYNSTNGLSDGGVYNGVLHFKSYGSNTDHSGGYPHQLSFTDNGNIWHRIGTSGTAWSTWLKLLDTNNYSGILDSHYVKKSGDTMTGLLTTTTGSNSGVKVGNTHITSTSGDLIIYKGGSIRFGGDAWDSDQWGGLRYVHYDKRIYLGIADGTIFIANQAQSNGSILTPGITNIYVGNNVTNKVWHAGNDGSGSGLDADLLDGVHASHIMENSGAGSASSGTSTGWFRIASSYATDAGGISCILLLWRNYSYLNNESYTFSINVAYNGSISITQLSGIANIRAISKIRVTGNANSGGYYIDLYIGISSNDNYYYWTTIGGFKSSNTWTANPSAGNCVKEFATVNGCKSDYGFTGNIAGNSSSATKLQTARSIWGQSFDGTGNVDGHLTINNSNLTTAN